MSDRFARALGAVLLAAVVALSPSLAPEARAHEADPEERAVGSLIDAELAFARLALEQGIRAAFLANFATDGIIFEPEPVRLYEAWSTRPTPPDPKAQRLEWKPSQAGVSRSRDMGYTTGAFTLTDVAKPDRVRRGVFFSVWQRDRDGKWQVILDAGVMTPRAVDFVPLGPAPRPRYAGRADAKAAVRDLLAQEKRTFSTDAKSARSYAALLASDVRLHRDDTTPLAGRDAVARDMAARATSVAWLPTEARVASSGDLAVTYGKYREIDRESRAHEGYYAHLWLRDAAGRWRLTYDIATPHIS